MRSKKISLVAIFALMAMAVFATQTWSRQYVGKSQLSFEAPVNIGAGVSESVEDPKDWVGKMTDYLAETENMYLQVTVFEAKDKSVGNHKKLSTVLNDIIDVFSDGTMKTTFTAVEGGGKIEMSTVDAKTSAAKMSLTETSVAAIDGYPAISTTFTKIEEDGTTVLKIMLVGDGGTVYSIFGLTGDDNEAGKKDLSRIMKSVRYKKGI